MSHKFNRAIRSSGYVFSDAECDAIKAEFQIDDIRSSVITTGSAMLWQFWAHLVFDSNGDLNRYTGIVDGENGGYPNRQAGSFLIDGAGKFKLPDNDLPVVNIADNFQLVPDGHRGNENPVLKAFHLAFARGHNKLVDKLGDYDSAKAANLATWTRLFTNEAMLVCDMSERELFDIKLKDFNRAIEFNFAVGRWAHAQMTDTTNGKPIFRSQMAGDVDMIALFDGSEMARELNMGVCPAMIAMDHVGGEPDIRERTFGQHAKFGLPTFADASRAYRLGAETELPLWAGVLNEAQEAGTGKLGTLGARMVADGIAGSLLNKYRTHNRWKGAPNKTLDIIEWAWG